MVAVPAAEHDAAVVVIVGVVGVDSCVETLNDKLCAEVQFVLLEEIL